MNAMFLRAESESNNTRQISKFYRALVRGIIEDDEVNLFNVVFIHFI
jgi:hypothetical protein